MAESDIPNLAASRIAALRGISALRAALHLEAEPGGRLPGDAAVVAFGSLARLELTPTSDLDFYVVTEEAEALRREVVDAGFVADLCRVVTEASFDPPPRMNLAGPGSSQIFGVYVSPPKLHETIGLDVDSNRQMTRRVLLLAESTSLLDSARHEELLKCLVHRYLRERRQGSEKPPRFLINDFVRYWRTLSVDFEAKADQGQRYGLRYLKLLVSRKFLFASTLFPLVQREQEQWSDNAMAEEMLVEEYASTPIERAVAAAVRLDAPTGGRSLEVIAEVLKSLDRFNGLLGDPEWRERVIRVSLNEEDPRGDAAFAEGLAVSASVDRSLRDLFFTEPLIHFTQEFLVF